MTPVDNALAQDKSAFRTVDEHLADLEKLTTDIEHATESVSDNLSEAQRLTSETRDISPGEQTLTQALETLKKNRKQADRDAMIASEKAVHARAMIEAKPMVAEAAERLVAAEKVLQSQEIERKALLKEAEIQQGRHNNAALDKAIAKSKLLEEYKANLPEIKSLLRSFITPGDVQVGSPEGRSFVYVPRRVPMSLARIKAFGALEKTDKGLERMHYVGGSKDNHRFDKGAFPAYSRLLIQRDEDVRKTVARAQMLLLKYSEILIEKGYLLE